MKGITVTLLIGLLYFLSFLQGASGVLVKVEDIPDGGGHLYIGWYDKAQDFRQVKKAVHKRVVPVAKGGTTHITFHGIQPGRYAISVFLDRNKNGLLDKNMVGIPQEPYGFSNNVFPMMRAASFDEAAFVVKGGEQLEIKLRN